MYDISRGRQDILKFRVNRSNDLAIPSLTCKIPSRIQKGEAERSLFSGIRRSPIHHASTGRAEAVKSTQTLTLISEDLLAISEQAAPLSGVEHQQILHENAILWMQ